MSQDAAPYRTELGDLAQKQAQTLSFVPHMRFMHTLEGLARQVAENPVPVDPPKEGRFTFHNDQYVVTYVIDHPGRRLFVKDISPSAA